jgi:hypothetical protein
MIDMIRRRAAIVLFLLLCSAGSLVSVWQVRHWGNALSLVDSYSEANVLREVRNFLEQGLMQDWGLGNVYHPGMYPDDGFAAEPEERKFGVSPEGVYTHYPPGPEYLLYASARLLGPEPVYRLRFLPIAIGWASMVVFGLTIRRRFGSDVGWLVMGACAITPTVTDGFAGLHAQGYAFALLLLEMSAAIAVRPRVFPFMVLGFLQGWLTFDYAFLVALTPLALEVVLPRIDPNYRPRWKLALARAVLAGAGFAVAHVMHFLQVWAYWGTLDATLRDFAGAAAHRAGSGLVGGPISYLMFVGGLLKLYFYGLHPLNLSLSLPDPGTPENWSMFRFLGLSLGPWWLLVTVGLMVWDRIHPNPANRAIRMNWHIVCLTGMMTSSVWLVIMLDHAGHHLHFLYRHLFFAFFVVVLFGAVTSCRAWAAAKSTEPRSRLLHRIMNATP